MSDPGRDRPAERSSLPPSAETPGLASVLSSRRMCRDFTGEPIDRSVLQAVLRAAFRAPSAGNTAALDLMVLGGEQVMTYWSTTMTDDRRAAFRWPGLLRAPVLVVPYVEPEAYVRRYAEPDKSATGLGADPDDWGVPYWWVDGGAAVMAMLLAAEAAGLGALFFGQFGHEPAVARRFGVPDGRRALGTVALGHPAAGGRRPSLSARTGRPDPSDRIHRDSW